MKNFFIQSLKKGFICLVTFSFAITSFSSQGYAGYGISIDIENNNLESPAVRVLFLNIDEQKVEEVNYYCFFSDREDKHSYPISKENQHSESPLLGFTFENKVLQEIIVKDNFTTDKYTVISKFPVRKAGDAQTLPYTANNDRYYKEIDAPRDLNDLTFTTPKKEKKQATHKPTFRYLEPKTAVIRTEDFLEKALGGPNGKAKTYTTHKEKLGESATLLTLLEYGYQIYDTKLPGRKGMDFMVSSGEDASKDTFVLVESKWTREDAAASVFLEKVLNNSLITDRLEKLLDAKTDGSISVMNLLRNFFTTSESKIGKLFYRILDKPGRARGIGNSAYKAVTEQERIEIGTNAGIIVPQVPAKASSGTPSPLEDRELAPFIEYLIERKVDLAPLSMFLKNQYAGHYQEYAAASLDAAFNEVLGPSFFDSPEQSKGEEQLDMAVDVKDTSHSSLSSEDESSSSEEKEDNPPRESFAKKRLSFGSASVEHSNDKKPTGEKKKTTSKSKEDPS